jgi:hypothetical protein
MTNVTATNERQTKEQKNEGGQHQRLVPTQLKVEPPNRIKKFILWKLNAGPLEARSKQTLSDNESLAAVTHLQCHVPR